MSKDLMPVGMKRVWSTHEVLSDKILESPYMFEHVSLISSDQCWVRTTKILNWTTQNRVLRGRKSTMETFLHQEMRARNFEHERRKRNNYDGNTGGKQERKQVNQRCENRKIVVSGKAKGKCAKESAWSFRHDESERGQFTRSTRPTPQLQTNSGKIFEKKAAQRQQSI